MSVKDKMGLTPAEIVAELDRFIVGQNPAKKAVAVALRNRYRRAGVEEPMRSEIVPKNILMIGSTGVGKTEIARRLPKLLLLKLRQLNSQKLVMLVVMLNP